MNKINNEEIDFRIVLTASLILFLAWLAFPMIYPYLYFSFISPEYYLSYYYVLEFLPAVLSLITGISLVLIHKRKMTLHALIVGFAVLLALLVVESGILGSGIIMVRRDIYWIFIQILILPIAAYVGAYVAMKFKNYS